MIPITRKEKYINEIVGGGNTAPETPQTREEIFYAAILGEVVAPSPITRAEKYLAKIANKYSGELPEPVTRIERFIARAAGMDIEIPTPITREEIFWSNYHAIVDFEVEGIPPLTFKSNGANLSNYRIYGNTVNGESVGDKTENLFDVELTDGYHLSEATGFPIKESRRFATLQPITINQSEYCLAYNSTTELRFMYSVFNDGTLIRRVAKVNDIHLQSGDAIDTTDGNKIYFAFYQNDYSPVSTEMISNIMLNTGSTPLPYEPNGYKVPVAVSNGTDTQTIPIYIPEQIRKVGNEAEYISYTDQKLHRVGAEDIDVNLPELPTLAGTNTLTVGTEVQPSGIEIKGRIQEVTP